MAAQMPKAGPKEPEPKDEILRIIHDILGDTRPDKGAACLIEELVVTGLRRVESDRLEKARSLEARENFRAFAATLRKYALGEGKSRIDKGDVDLVLGRLCPIYPIC